MNEIDRHQLGNPSDYLRYVVAADLSERRHLASTHRLRRMLRRDHDHR